MIVNGNNHEACPTASAAPNATHPQDSLRSLATYLPKKTYSERDLNKYIYSPPSPLLQLARSVFDISSRYAL